MAECKENSNEILVFSGLYKMSDWQGMGAQMERF